MKTDQKNSALNTFQTLIGIDEFNGSTALAIGSIPKDATGIQYRKFNIDDGLSNRFQDMVLTKLDSANKSFNKQKLKILPYDPGYKPENDDIEWINYPESVLLSNLLDQIPILSDIALYDAKEDEINKDLRFYALFFETKAKEKLICFSLYVKMKELSKGGIITRKIGNRFELLKETGFIFDERIDCILFRNHIFIFHKGRFHKIFRYYEQIQSMAESSLYKIHEVVPISNIDKFQTVCMAHSVKMLKLVNIAGKPYLSSITMDDVKRTILRHNLSLEIVKEDGIEKILFDSQDPWVVLNLFDDAYLDSELTQLAYEVNSKRLME